MTRRLMILGLLAAAACGGSKTAPSEQIANYGGSWSGTYSVTGCNQTGGVALANICGALGQTPPYSMTLTQSQRNVSGVFRLGSTQFPQTGGTVGQDNSLQLNATSSTNGITVIVSWNLRMTGQQMTGSVSQQWASDTLSGGATVSGTINTAVHSASTAPAASLVGLTIGEIAALAGRE